MQFKDNYLTKYFWLKMTAVYLLGCLMSGSLAAEGPWKRVVSIDQLSDKKIVLEQNRALNTFQQFGRTVTATLVMQCEPPLYDYPMAAIVFSATIGVEHAYFRYRFDDDSVVEPAGGQILAHGSAIEFASHMYVPERIDRLTKASKFRIELDLPWAGNTLLKFNTSGAGAALANLPCARIDGTSPR